MSKAITGVVGFIFGATIGSAATWYLVKDRYEKIAQDEIEEVRNFYRGKNDEDDTDDKHEADPADVNDYKKKVSNLNYSVYSQAEKTKNDISEVKKEPKKYTDGPYVISPEEFGEFDSYEQIELKYLADHILVDDDYEPIEDVDAIVGFESLNHFGDYEDDSVFVRNDKLKCDYEILLDQRKSSDLLREKPYLRRFYE